MRVTRRGLQGCALTHPDNRKPLIEVCFISFDTGPGPEC